MKMKVINQHGKYMDEPYREQIIDAVHNDIDEFSVEGRHITVISVYTSDDIKTIRVDIADA